MKPYLCALAMATLIVAGLISCIEVISVPERAAAKARQAQCATHGGVLVLDVTRVERCVGSAK